MSMKIKLKAKATAAVLLLLCAPAFAFQETKVTPPAAGGAPSVTLTPGVPAGASAAEQKPSIQLQAPSDPAKSGTEIRLPGLGKLGVLPKTEFGLEILYGASESQRQGPQTPASDETTVQGRIRHKF